MLLAPPLAPNMRNIEKKTHVRCFYNIKNYLWFLDKRWIAAELVELICFVATMVFILEFPPYGLKNKVVSVFWKLRY